VQVTGSCIENVLIRNEKVRVIVDGGGTASIHGPDSTSPTIRVRGKGILIQGFTITGGREGISVERGSNSIINNNDISNAAGNGMRAGELAFVVITNNNIHSNGFHGIFITETSTARIGFNLSNDSSPSPNMIQANDESGILVSRGSSAQIVSNSILNNGANGVSVTRASQADIASNTINGNGGSGVLVSTNSGVNLGNDDPFDFFDQPNVTTVNNVTNGIRCRLGGYVDGHLGSTNPLNGTAGQLDISPNCPNGLATP
jgi:hypothetical protein